LTLLSQTLCHAIRVRGWLRHLQAPAKCAGSLKCVRRSDKTIEESSKNNNKHVRITGDFVRITLPELFLSDLNLPGDRKSHGILLITKKNPHTVRTCGLKLVSKKSILSGINNAMMCGFTLSLPDSARRVDLIRTAENIRRMAKK
jgi:hypothetical protein